MQGLLNLALQRFASDTYGAAFWAEIARSSRLGLAEFEAMMPCDPCVTEEVLTALSAALDKPRAVLLEDMGTYLVSHPNSAPIRRLLRFAGATFEDFLHSLDELPERARLAHGRLDVPPLELRQHAPERFSLSFVAPVAGFGHVLVGVLRAMADDYGALVTLEHDRGGRGREVISITLVVASFATARDFDLGARTG